MSLYNIVHGESGNAGQLIDLLQAVEPMEVGRFRDAWVEGHGDKLVIRVHTRNGGGNRESEDIAAANASMAAHPWYDHDADGDFDYTYADFYFNVSVDDLGGPNDDDMIRGDVLRWLVGQAQGPVDMGERWNAAIEAIRNA